MIRKAKGLSVITTKGVIEQILPKDKIEKEKVIFEKFCKIYSEEKKSFLKIEEKREAPDFRCSLDNSTIFIELCELVNDDGLRIDAYASKFEEYFKKEFYKRFKIPSDICIEIICFNLRKIPNINKKEGQNIVLQLIEYIINEFSIYKKIDSGKWKYLIWKKCQCWFEIRIIKLPFNFPVPKKSGIEIMLTGINTVDSKTHNNLLTETIDKKNRKNYIIPDNSFLWLVIYSYRYFPLDLKEEVVKRCVLEWNSKFCKFNQIWYFYPCPINKGIMFQLYGQKTYS